MNPFTQEINRILIGRTDTMPASSFDVDAAGSKPPAAPTQSASPTVNHMVTQPAIQTSLQNISSGFETQGRRYNRFLSTEAT